MAKSNQSQVHSDRVQKLKELIAEKGYESFTLAKNHRRGQYDFLAIPKEDATRFAMASFRKGRITFRPYAAPRLYATLREVLARARQKYQIPAYWSSRLLPHVKFRNYMQFLLPPEQRAQLKQLVPELFVEDEKPQVVIPLYHGPVTNVTDSRHLPKRRFARK